MIKDIKNGLKKILNHFPYIRVLYKQGANTLFPNGHFYSPVISIEDVKLKEKELWASRDIDGILGIDLNKANQIQLLKDFEEFYNEIPFQDHKLEGYRYYFKNNSYSYTDGIFLHSMIQKLKPKRIIEIGSGNSSAMIMDTNDYFFNKQIDLTFIDPYPEILYSIMKENDLTHNKVISSDVQLVDLDVFRKLESGDILFVDSTHVSKTGSDVNFILFDILPILSVGVYIHFHDIFYPFEYPKKWVFEGRNWNENYILKAFLMYNNNYQIQLFSDYVNLHIQNPFQNLPLCNNNPGGNLWIKKIS